MARARRFVVDMVCAVVCTASVLVAGCTTTRRGYDLDVGPTSAAEGADGDARGERGSTSGDAAAAGEGPPVCPATTNYESDPKNCGRCGRDCLGGGCTNKNCSQVVIATNQTKAVVSLVVVGSDVYWVTTNDWMLHVFHRSADGKTADISPPDASSLGVARLFFAQGRLFLFADEYGGAKSRPLWKRSAEGAWTYIDRGSFGQVAGVAHDNDFFYVTTTRQFVTKLSLSAKTADEGTTITIPAAWGMLRAPTSDGKNLYAFGDGTKTTIYRFGDSGGVAIGSHAGASQAGAAAVDATNLYWSGGIASGDTYVYHLFRTAKVGGTTVEVAAIDGQGASSVVVDADNVYWSEMDQTLPRYRGSVRMKPKGVGSLVVLEDDISSPAVAVSDAAIAWADNKTGRVILLAK